MNDSYPLYSYYSCYNFQDILVTGDSGDKFCSGKVGELPGCSKVYADTSYLMYIIALIMTLDLFLISMLSLKK